MTRLAGGGLEGRSADRSSASGFDYSDTAYTLGWGRALPGVSPFGTMNLGANVKYIESRIGNYSASTFALDLGLVHQFRDRPFSLGISALNLGRGIKFRDQTDPLPLTFTLGGAWRMAGTFNLAADIRHEPYDRRTDVGIGTEYTLMPALSLRAGYTRAASARLSREDGASPLNGLGAGIGLRMSNYKADYTFTPFGELGNVQRISLGARF